MPYKVENTINTFTKKRSEFQSLKLHEAIDWDKYNLMFISHHSTAIEGSSLTVTESQLLLDEGLTPKGKPFEHSQMERDHYKALMLVAREAEAKRNVTPEFIRTVAARVMHGTGKEYNEVEGMVKALCEDLEKKIDKVNTAPEIYNMAFDFHYDLVSIHPFADGNGRVSRLIMNYLLMYHGETPAIIHKEDRQEYIDSLKESREIKSPQPMRKFLYDQQIKQFDRQIETRRSDGKDIFLTFMA